MKKASFLFLSACLFLTGCGGQPGSQPVTVPENTQTESGAAAEIEQRELLENALRTPGGVYYQISEYRPIADEMPPALPPGSITFEQAAEKAGALAASLGFEVKDRLWSVTPALGDPAFSNALICCSVDMPPCENAVPNYSGTLGDLQPGQYPWGIYLTFTPDGSVYSYLCNRPAPFDLEEHTSGEQAARRLEIAEWKAGDEFLQLVQTTLGVLGIGPFQRMEPLTDDGMSMCAVLENGDTYFVDAFLGTGVMREVTFSTLYINGSELRAS